MKKSILLFITILFVNVLSAQWSGSSPYLYTSRDNVGINFSSAIGIPSTTNLVVQTTASEGHPLQLGKYLSTPDLWNFNFGIDTDYVGFSMYDPSGIIRTGLSANDSDTSFTLYDENQQEIFKVSRGETYGSYIQLPKSDSKVVIGDFVSYSGASTYKLYIRNGAAKVEGNFVANGSVGIGTSSFSDGLTPYKLSVNGKIRAHGIKVYNTWADFVFYEDYDLPTLEEVEAFIKKYGHLENIPTAEEVETNGIDLGEMNKLLLQKIEELTLYTIALNKRIGELEKQ